MRATWGAVLLLTRKKARGEHWILWIPNRRLPCLAADCQLPALTYTHLRTNCVAKVGVGTEKSWVCMITVSL